jgi:Tol biopolymer transport system component
MELVDGPTLAERIERGALPPDEALPIAQQVAEAVEYAHSHGVIHRDLKPANVKLASDGSVKVLDFGLAKVLDAGLAAGANQSPADLLSSPTLSVIGTRAGTILGTAAYMSPEQAKGKPVDQRTDVWAFGCVLYEMLTGSRPFFGETAADTLAAIVRADPDWSRIPADVPSRVKELLQRCLQKEPRSRLQSIGDARVLLEEIASQPAESVLDDEQRIAHKGPRWRAALPWVLAGLATVAALAFYLTRSRATPSFTPMAATLFSASELDDPAISPDGRKVVFVHKKHLWVRNLDELEPHELEDTEGAANPFWSSDSNALAYARDKELRVVAATGGASRVLWKVAPLQGFLGGTWSGERIVVAAGPLFALWEIPASGGAPKEITKPDPAKDEDALLWPRFLPDGQTLMLTVSRRGPGLTTDTLAAQQGSERKVILQVPGTTLVFIGLAPGSGDLFYLQTEPPNDGVWSVPFSLSKLQVTGTPVLLQAHSGDHVSVSRDGTLVYVKGFSGASELVWIDRDGKILGHIGAPQRGLQEPAVAPDRVHVAVTSKFSTELLVEDTRRSVAVKINRGEGAFYHPVWTPDGKHIAFLVSNDKGLSLAIASADGSGTIREIPLPKYRSWGRFSFIPDGDYVVIGCREEAKWEVCKLPLNGEGKPEKVVSRPADAGAVQLSPDGRFLAYQSTESGRWEIYVETFPTGGGRWQVSTGGGTYPRWNPNGKELAYLEGPQLMVVPVETKAGFVPGAPRPVASAENLRSPLQEALFGYSADGEKFVIPRAATTDTLDIIAVQNWLSAKTQPR